MTNTNDAQNEDGIAKEIKDDSALLASALGGWRGVIDSGLPFVILFTWLQNAISRSRFMRL